MSPINEFELRQELAAADPGIGRPASELGQAAILRGRGVQRRRTAVAVVATLALVAGGVGVATQFLPDRTTTPAEPLPPVVTTETPSEVPSTDSAPPTTEPSSPPVSTLVPTETGGVGAWTSASTLPGEYGDTQGLTPMHWQAPADGEMGAWETSHDNVLTCGEPIEVPALTSVKGGKTISALGPEQVVDESVLVFADNATAAAFMAQLLGLAETCAAAEPYQQPGGDELSPTIRTLAGISPVHGVADEAFMSSTWSEAKLDPADDWVVFPGGSATLWARSGHIVMMSGNSGEYVGDPTVNPDTLTYLRPAVDEVLAQM